MYSSGEVFDSVYKRCGCGWKVTVWMEGDGVDDVWVWMMCGCG